jgi:hypothetical protein
MSFFLTQKDTDKELESAPWLAVLKKLDAEGQEEAANKFLSGAQTPLTGGFGSSSKSAREIAFQGAMFELHRQQLIKRRWEVLEEYQRQLALRHTAEGHSLNFGQRALRVRKFLEADFREAIMKALTAKDGVNAAHHLGVGAEFLTADEPLDALVNWTRDVIDQVEQRTHFETLVHGHFEIGDPRLGAWTGGGHPFIGLDMPKHLSQEQISTLRLRSIGAHFALKEHTTSEYWLYRASVICQVGRRAPFRLTDVSVVPPDPARYRSDRLVLNETVTDGAVQVQLD